MISPAPCGSAGLKALMACSMPCFEVQPESVITMPESILEKDTPSRASRSEPSFTARARYFDAYSAEVSASISLILLALFERKHSVA